MAALACDIVTPAKRLFSSEAYMVIVPGVEGEMGFLPGHAPTVSVLADGVVRLKNEDGSNPRAFALQGGYVEVTGEKVIILADRAVAVEDIDVQAVRDHLAELQDEAAGKPEAELAKTMLPADIAWCNVRIKAAEAA
ncbi:ATP synthase F1 subunit epsilon [Adlercreutzia sp. ZJ141]|uniref:ATP synthase F1 subunit epsilon n=1 Tax=Adlercreutzia sp. ZJ141 TaxID=2709406 RepID=UPI0013E9D7D4|nr:ATP synthase F1 subunit epsilon [Adlercreutzia sp. ZJ141]